MKIISLSFVAGDGAELFRSAVQRLIELKFARCDLFGSGINNKFELDGLACRCGSDASIHQGIRQETNISFAICSFYKSESSFGIIVLYCAFYHAYSSMFSIVLPDEGV